MTPRKRCCRCRRRRLHKFFYLRKTGKQAGRLMELCMDCSRTGMQRWTFELMDLKQLKAAIARITERLAIAHQVLEAKIRPRRRL